MLWFGKKKERVKRSRVAVLVAHGVEQTQLDATVKQLRSAGADVFLVGLRPGKIQALRALRSSAKIPVDVTIAEVHPSSFTALVIPGGTLASDQLRQNVTALEFVRVFINSGRPIAAIGHGAAVLASAGVLNGRRLTGWPAIKDDIVNAGGVWEDKPYVQDGNLLTGRTTRDVAKFSKRLVKHIGEKADV